MSLNSSMTAISAAQRNAWLLGNNRLFSELVNQARQGLTNNLFKNPITGDLIMLPPGSIPDVQFYTNMDETELYENPIDRRYLPPHLVKLGCKPISVDEARRVYEKIRSRVYQVKNKASYTLTKYTWDEDWAAKEKLIAQGDKALLNSIDTPPEAKIWGGSEVGYIDNIPNLFGLSDDEEVKAPVKASGKGK